MKNLPNFKFEAIFYPRNSNEWVIVIVKLKIQSNNEYQNRYNYLKLVLGRM